MTAAVEVDLAIWGQYGRSSSPVAEKGGEGANET
jgi:hypothetical protein